MLARSFSSDVSISLCLKTLQLLWDSEPYSWGPELMGFEYPEIAAYETKELSRAAISGKIWLAGHPQELENCAHILYRSIRGALVRSSPYYSSPYSGYQEQGWAEWQNDRSSIANAVEDMLRIDTDISTYSRGCESLTECALRWRCLDIWKDALEKSGCQSMSSTLWKNNAHFYDPIGFVSCELGTSVHVSGDAGFQKVILVVDELHYPENWQFWDGWDYKRRERPPRDPELKSLTDGWPYLIELPQVHCEVYPSQPIVIDSSHDGKHETLASDDHTSTPEYKLQETEDGGIELFIDCCGMGEPWKRLCAEVRREQGLEDDESSEWGTESDYCYSDSGTDEDHGEGTASTGVFSKIAGVGLNVLSAFV
jgi:hypothetical protein